METCQNQILAHSVPIFHFFTEYNAPKLRPSGKLIRCNSPGPFDCPITSRQQERFHE